jgi:hypothetical protein
MAAEAERAGLASDGGKYQAELAYGAAKGKPTLPSSMS